LPRDIRPAEEFVSNRLVKPMESQKDRRTECDLKCGSKVSDWFWLSIQEMASFGDAALKWEDPEGVHTSCGLGGGLEAP